MALKAGFSNAAQIHLHLFWILGFPKDNMEDQHRENQRLLTDIIAVSTKPGNEVIAFHHIYNKSIDFLITVT